MEIDSLIKLREWITSPDWQKFFEKQTRLPYWEKLESFLQQEIQQGKKVYPLQQKIFRVFNALSPQKIKVMILGQDPYHQKGQADGFAFSASTPNQPLPPSLQNIFKEILQTKKLQSNKLKGDLSAWVSQGVFLLNTILTVRDSEPLSHQNFGWQNLIQNTLIYLDATPRCILLWGKNASFYKKNFTNPKHLILETSHPSPFLYIGVLLVVVILKKQTSGSKKTNKNLFVG